MSDLNLTKSSAGRHRLGQLLRFVSIPAAVYSICFVLATYPLVTKFSDVLWSDAQDAWVTLWNFWWVNKALTDLHQLPWHTTWIHYPYGISLWTHTLNVYNSLLSIGLVHVLSPIQTYNLLLFLTFPLAGVAVFLFAYYFTRAYTASLLAGYAFAFSNYHIGQARAHLNLSSIEFIPVFVFCWYLLLQKPSRRAALGAVVALLLTTLCDYYLLFYCVLAAAAMLIWKIVKARDFRFFFTPAYRGPWLLFMGAALVTIGSLVVPLVIATLQDPTGGHNPERFSLDLVAIVVPGRAWRFAPLTSDLWSRWSGNPVENNVALGFGNLALVVYAWFQRKRPGNASIVLWTLLFALFLVLSLGPRLHVNGDIVAFFRLPYGILLDALPLLAVSGVPVRMMLMVSLFTAVLGGFAFAALFAGNRWQRMFGVALAVLLVFETFPKPIPTSDPTVPAYVQVLAGLPGTGVVLDQYAIEKNPDPTIPRGEMMYYQSVHQKPMALGYVARIPTSTGLADSQLRLWVEQGRFDILCQQYGIRYFVAPTNKNIRSEFLNPANLLYGDKQAAVYELVVNGHCVGS